MASLFERAEENRRRILNLLSLRKAAKTAPTVEESLERKRQLFEFGTQQPGGGLVAMGQRLRAEAGLRRTREQIIQTQQEEAPTIASREAALERRRRRLRTGRRDFGLLTQTGQQGPGGQLLV
jgi:hypothetical protein